MSIRRVGSVRGRFMTYHCPIAVGDSIFVAEALGEQAIVVRR